jgi:hypothetical protein
MDNDINAVCEAVNCFAPATKVVKVKVGQKGSICLLLCETCQSKFQEGKLDE